MSSTITKLGDLCSVITKGTTPTSVGFDFSDSGVRFLRVQNVFGGKVNYACDTLFIDPEVHGSLKRSQIAPGDVLISIAGTIGRTAIVPDDAPDLNCNQAIAILRTNERITRPFLRHWLESADAQRQMRGAIVTGTIQNLSLSQIAELRIPLPSVVEQRRIAAILDKADALRTKRREALALLDRLAQAIFVEMFGDPMENPKKWPVRAMSDLFETSPIFGTMIPPSVDGGAWLSLRVANIQDWKLDLSDRKFVSLPANMIERHSVKDGDLLLARAIASQEHLGKAVVAKPCGALWAFDSHLMRLRFDTKEALPEFVRLLWMTPGGRALFLKATRRSAVQFNINTGEMNALKLPIPPLELQRTFVNRVGVLDSIRSGHEAGLAEMDALFTSLQHRAFRGEL